MGNDVKLVICIHVYDLFPKDIEFVYTIMSLDNIDQLTYPFENEEEFFAMKKGAIFARLMGRSKAYDIESTPSDIYLNPEVKNSIYLVKNGKKIRPLFKTIQRNNETITIEELAKERLQQGMLKYLYLFDEQGTKDPNYESIFKNCDVKVLARTKANLIREEDIDFIWSFFQKKNRFYPIFRFILSSGTNEMLWDTFAKTIPLKEIPEEREYTRTRKSKKYWYQEN